MNKPALGSTQLHVENVALPAFGVKTAPALHNHALSEDRVASDSRCTRNIETVSLWLSLRHSLPGAQGKVYPLQMSPGAIS